MPSHSEVLGAGTSLYDSGGTRLYPERWLWKTRTAAALVYWQGLDLSREALPGASQPQFSTRTGEGRASERERRGFQNTPRGQVPASFPPHAHTPSHTHS